MHFGVEARASAESTILKLPSAKLNVSRCWEGTTLVVPSKLKKVGL